MDHYNPLMQLLKSQYMDTILGYRLKCLHLKIQETPQSLVYQSKLKIGICDVS